jgi:hypothetical protein
MYDAFTAPARAYRGEIPHEDMIGEGLNFAGNMALGGAAAPRPANALASNSLRQVAANNALSQPKGIRAYHGSPHDFDKFDLSKIGTGEGAQAFGHGLYFAENENVANAYRRALAGADDGGHTNALEAFIANGNDRLKALAYAREKAKTGLMPDLPTINAISKANWEKSVALLENENYRPLGRTYEVSINADPDDFLDWDKPLSQQSEKVRGLLAPTQEKIAREREALRPSLDKVEPAYKQHAIDSLNQQIAAIRNGDETVGTFLSDRSWGRGKNEETTKMLRDLGIPGIKYLDQGSRSAGEGSRNYVVFDDNLIEILRKYGLFGTLGAGGAAAGLMSGSQPSDAAPMNALARR